jgi:hypothetical protein
LALESPIPLLPIFAKKLINLLCSTPKGITAQGAEADNAGG